MSRDLRPHYRLVEQDGPFEIRVYAPMTLAEIVWRGDRRTALNEGFKALYAFISGANAGQAKLAMSVPVTAQAEGEDAWAVRFVMPPDRATASLPAPADSRIALFDVPPARAAVKRFAGLANDRRIALETARLEAWLAAHELLAAGPPACAFYNSPLTLPFLRHNEIMIGLKY